MELPILHIRAEMGTGKRLNYYKRQKERSPTNYGRMYWDGRIDELKLNSQKDGSGK